MTMVFIEITSTLVNLTNIKKIMTRITSQFILTIVIYQCLT